MNIGKVLVCIMIVSLYGAEKKTVPEKRKYSSLRNGTSAQQVVVKEELQDEEDVTSPTKLRLSPEGNKRVQDIIALARVRYDFSKGMPSAEELLSNAFWLRLHFEEHHRKIAEYESQKASSQ